MRKPNILRRKSKPTACINLVDSPQEFILEISVQNDLPLLNNLVRILPKQKAPKEKAPQEITPKAFPRRRKSPQRIILDSYWASNNDREINSYSKKNIPNIVTTSNNRIISKQTYFEKNNITSQQLTYNAYDAENLFAESEVEVEHEPEIILEVQADDSDLEKILNQEDNIKIEEKSEHDVSSEIELISNIKEEPLNDGEKCEIFDPNCYSQIVKKALESIGIANDDLYYYTNASDGSKCWLCPCGTCKSVFKTQYKLKNHILLHYKLSPFKCTFSGCAKKFRLMSSLRSHFQTHKSKETKSLLKPLTAVPKKRKRCPAEDCSCSFDQWVKLSEHLALSHNIENAPYKCSICKKRFWWLSGLMSHLRSHNTVESICKWPGCKMKFSIPSRFKSHMRSHKNEKFYKCDYPKCTWAFESASKLKRHELRHNAIRDRNHTCNICSRNFLRFHHLTDHLTTHNPQSYSCDFPGCEEKFTHKRSIYLHKKQRHADGKINSHKSKKFTRPNQNLPTGKSIVTKSARTHVPLNINQEISIITTMEDILPQTTSGDKNQGNPLVCGGLEFDNSGVVSVVGSTIPELGSDLLGTSANHISLLQEELVDGMLFTSEADDSVMAVLLLNGDQGP